jgi:hypothetical protein
MANSTAISKKEHEEAVTALVKNMESSVENARVQVASLEQLLNLIACGDVDPSNVLLVVKASMSAHPLDEEIQVLATCVMDQLMGFNDESTGLKCGYIAAKLGCDDEVIKAMRNHPKVTCLQRCALACLRFMSLADPKIADRIRSQQALDLALKALTLCNSGQAHHGNQNTSEAPHRPAKIRPIQETRVTCYEIAEMTYASRRYTDPRISTVLDSLETHMECPVSVFMVLRVILCFVVDQPANSRMLEMRGVNLIMACMRQHAKLDKALDLGCRSLMHILDANPALEKCILQENEMFLLVLRASRGYSSEGGTPPCGQCSLIMRAMTPPGNAEMRVMFGKEGGVRIVSELMRVHMNNARVVRCCMEAVYYFHEVMDRHGCVDLLSSKIMETFVSAGQLHAGVCM